jgi:hypothetical protein
MSRCLAILCLSVLFAARTQAWNAEGHMVVAQIAYNHLDSVVRTRCDALIAVPLTNTNAGTTNFVTAACWADDFKSALGTGIWHYLDQPFSLDGTSTNSVGASSFDVVRAIRQCVTTLQNTNAAATNRATNLRYLLHFVGDIQQPLHCSTAVSASRPGGDAGGNSFLLSGTNWSNLHSLWDEGGGFLSDSVSRPLSATGRNNLSSRVALVEAATPFVGNPGIIADPQPWAREGLVISQTNCYVGITNNAAPTSGYLTNANATASARLALGGKRLADLLNTIFAPTPVALAVQPTAAGNFAFGWSSGSGQTYRVQWKNTLTQPGWNDEVDVLATSTSAGFTNAITTTQRFYRVVGVD